MFMSGRSIGSMLVLLLAGLAACTASIAQEGSVARGKQLFTAQGCYGCHMIEKYGTPIATDLSHIGSKWSVEELTRWLKDPAAQKPTAHMPKIAMSESEAQALADYLGSLR
jgi:mono/diheme cytochrome c family protein